MYRIALLASKISKTECIRKFSSNSMTNVAEVKPIQDFIKSEDFKAFTRITGVATFTAGIIFSNSVMINHSVAPIEKKIDGLSKEVNEKIDSLSKEVNEKIDGLNKEVNEVKNEVNKVKNEAVYSVMWRGYVKILGYTYFKEYNWLHIIKISYLGWRKVFEDRSMQAVCTAIFKEPMTQKICDQYNRVKNIEATNEN
ncbi:hypothetical protein C1646_670830 [Rhizophagus diaphanus]|nr:hypothetical protein C1646_670830 [Rhizophagus diaphanus] [Rhizophagus sp. MUCL 43196]